MVGQSRGRLLAEGLARGLQATSLVLKVLVAEANGFSGHLLMGGDGENVGGSWKKLLELKAPTPLLPREASWSTFAQLANLRMALSPTALPGTPGSELSQLWMESAGLTEKPSLRWQVRAPRTPVIISLQRQVTTVGASSPKLYSCSGDASDISVRGARQKPGPAFHNKGGKQQQQ